MYRLHFLGCWMRPTCCCVAAAGVCMSVCEMVATDHTSPRTAPEEAHQPSRRDYLVCVLLSFPLCNAFPDSVYTSISVEPGVCC